MGFLLFPPPPLPPPLPALDYQKKVKAEMGTGMGEQGWRHRDGDWDGEAGMEAQGWGHRDEGRDGDWDGGTGWGHWMAGMRAQG